MKRYSTLSFLLLIFFAAFGCKSSGQVPPTSHSVLLTWTGPCTAGQTAAQCAYVVSSAIITGSTCPSTTGTNYTPLNQSSPTTASTYTDVTSVGKTVCYIAQTVEGTAVSVPSNVAGPFTIPANPTAPAIQGTQAELARPPVPQITPKSSKDFAAHEIAPVQLVAKLGR